MGMSVHAQERRREFDNSPCTVGGGCGPGKCRAPLTSSPVLLLPESVRRNKFVPRGGKLWVGPESGFSCLRILMALPNRSCLVNSTCPPMQRTDLPYPSALVMAEGPTPTVGGLGGGLVLSWPSVRGSSGLFHDPQPTTYRYLRITHNTHRLWCATVHDLVPF